MSTPANPISSFSLSSALHPMFDLAGGDNTGGGSTDTTGTDVVPQPIQTAFPNPFGPAPPPPTINTNAQGQPVSQKSNAPPASATTWSSSTFFGFSLLRLALFLLGLIFIIGGIYMLKPGIIEAPVRVVKGGLETAGAAAAIA